MTKVTRYLNFVVPNKEVLKKIKSQVDTWIQSRGVDSLKNLQLRITTATMLKNAEEKDESCWQIIYKFNKGAEPVKTID